MKRSDMTAVGWTDYQRGVAEVAAQRSDNQSRYPGISRVHCHNGYVDVRSANYANGATAAMTVDDFRAKVRAEGKRIYDYHYR